jgi:hypothetical protein
MITKAKTAMTMIELLSIKKHYASLPTAVDLV